LQVSIFCHNDCKGFFCGFSGSAIGLWSKSLFSRDSRQQLCLAKHASYNSSFVG
jgi:hypothetical protein